jgi:hypothetical protein
MLKRNRINPDGFSTNLHRLSTREGAEILFSPRESPFVEHSTHPKRLCEIFSFWVPLIIFESESVLWDGWIYMLLLSLVIIILVWFEFIDRLIFFSNMASSHP